ncbi:MAG: hypothetical protein HC932_06580, partial [Thermales bacterium]|nr:hypothetical protein [Thermales bacterium]
SSNDSGNLTPEQRDRFGCVDLRGGTEKSPLDDDINPDTVDPNDPRVIGSNFIEQPFTVENTNQSEWLTQNDDIRDGVDPFVRNVQFDVVSDNWSEIQESYDGERQVWIVVHGWYKDPDDSSYLTNYMNTTAHIIRDKKPNDIVMLLDWREAAAGGKFGSFTEVFRASRWIRPVAREAKTKLNQWGLNSGTKVNFVGHSLGTLLSTELAREFGGANKSVLLEPPSQFSLQNFCQDVFLCWGYDIDGNTSDNQVPKVNIDGDNYYKNQFNFSRSFVGSRSSGGNQYLAPTTHESISVDFEGEFCPSGWSESRCQGDEHMQVTKVFNRINTDTELYNGMLSVNDLNYSASVRNWNLGQNSIGSGFEGELKVIKHDSPFRTWTESLETRLYDFPNYSSPYLIPYVYGTEQGTNIRSGYRQENEVHMYSGGNDDILWVNDQSVRNYYVHDFEVGDLLILNPYSRDRFSKVINGLQVILTSQRTGQTIIIEGSGVGAFNNSSVLEESYGLIDYR